MNTKGKVNGKVVGREYYLADTNAIVDPCCVIADCGGEPDAFFLVRNRTEWSEMFLDWLQRPHREDDEEVGSATKEEDSDEEEEQSDEEDQEKDGNDQGSDNQDDDGSEEQADSDEEDKESD